MVEAQHIFKNLYTEIRSGFQSCYFFRHKNYFSSFIGSTTKRYDFDIPVDYRLQFPSDERDCLVTAVQRPKGHNISGNSAGHRVSLLSTMSKDISFFYCCCCPQKSHCIFIHEFKISCTCKSTHNSHGYSNDVNKSNNTKVKK